MARPRAYQTEAVVLKSTPVGEGGLIVTLYSKDTGKLRAVVRGARKPTSKMVGHLEPLNRVQLALARAGHGGLDTVTQGQVLESFATLKASLEPLSRAIYLAELIDGFGTEGSPSPELYALLVDTLRVLDGSHRDELTLRYFELHLLNLSGFMPELYRCVECREELSPGLHRFTPEAGGALCLRCTPPRARIMSLSLQAIKVMRFLDRSDLPDIARFQVHGELEEELKSLLGATLKYWLDKEIQSKRFMEHLEHSHKSGVYKGSSRSPSILEPDGVHNV